MKLRNLTKGVGVIRHRIKPAVDARKTLAARFLPPDPIVVEAGAHVGGDTVEMARRWRTGTVHAFEPLPHLFIELERRTSRLANVRRYPSALGTSTGTTQIWVSRGPDQASSSLLTPKTVRDAFPDISFPEQVEVPITTLDDWATSQGVDRVDFMWLDMQGYELATLKHSESVLPTVRAIVLEISFEELYENMPLWPEVKDWLATRGLAVVAEAPASETYGDALVVRQDLLDLADSG